MSQEQLQRQLLSGDAQVFGEFYQDTKLKLMGMLKTKVANDQDAEEILQDTYLSFLDSLPLFEGKSSLETYLWAIARHEVADYWRKKYAKKAIRTVPFVDQVYSEKLYGAAETAAEMGGIYKRMKKTEVKLLKMKYEQGMSVKEIATELKVSVKAAESKLFRARRSFQAVYLAIEDGA